MPGATDRLTVGVRPGRQRPGPPYHRDAFGVTLSRTGSAPTPFGFGGASGYQGDAGTGLLLLGSRYYGPSLGRFLSQDPIGAGDNWYAYCGNGPLTGVDPTGLAPQPYGPYYPGGSYYDPGKNYTVHGGAGTYAINVPTGQDINNNIENALAERQRILDNGRIFDPSQEINYVSGQRADGTVGDYKDVPQRIDPKINNTLRWRRELAGNYNFGAIGAASGIGLTTLLLKGDLGRFPHLHPAPLQQAIIDGFRAFQDHYAEK